MSVDVQKWLKQQEKEWKDIAVEAKQSTGFDRVPDGRYVSRLSGADLCLSKSSDKLQIKWSWVILEGEYQGEQILDFDGLEREDALLWLGRKLYRLGIDPETVKLSKLEKTLSDLVESAPVAVLSCKTRNDFQRVSIDKLIDDYEGEEPEDDENDGETEDPEVGDTVIITVKDKELTGEITEVDADEETAKVKAGRKTHTVGWDDLEYPETEEEEKEEKEEEEEESSEPDEPTDAEEEEEEEKEEEEEEEVDLAVGMTVEFEKKGKSHEGVVRSINEDEEIAKVRVGNKVYSVAISDLVMVEEEDDA